MNQTLTLTWNDLQRDTKILAQELRRNKPWHGIVAVTRGGMVPATLLAYEMELRVVDTISLASYDAGHQQNDLEVLSLPSINGDGEGWLVIDDLVDTGVTAKVVRKILPQAHIAVIYAKPKGKSAVDTLVKEINQDTWIIFPWEEDM